MAEVTSVPVPLSKQGHGKTDIDRMKVYNSLRQKRLIGGAAQFKKKISSTTTCQEDLDIEAIQKEH